MKLSLARLHAEARAILESSGPIDEVGDYRVFDTVRNVVDAATRKRGTTYAGPSASLSASD